jgi:uncharacterized damage-inducible protein DinB
MLRRLAAILLVLAAPTLFALQNAKKAAPKDGFRTELLADLDDVQSKIVALANAVPADKYSWRPGPDVRSISEVFMHIAGTNYFLATFLGVKAPADLPDMEKITDKARVVVELQKSFDHLRAIVKSMPDADLEKPVNFMGSPTTRRGLLITALNHMHEHLGQSIAYARMNRVVPPWSK